MKLLNVGHNAKTIKSDRLKKFLTGIVYLAPAKTSGSNLCPSHTIGCATSCLFFAGFGRYTKIRQYRINKTLMFLNDRQNFVSLLEKDLQSLITKCEKLSVKPACRINGLSDIKIETVIPQVFTKFPQIQFYDYTKQYKRMLKFLNGELPHNYHLTFSRSETNENECVDILNKGGNVAIVSFKKPRKWKGFRVINGDLHDLRFTDPKNVVVWLYPKGKAKHDKTGFVIQTARKSNT